MRPHTRRSFKFAFQVRSGFRLVLNPTQIRPASYMSLHGY